MSVYQRPKCGTRTPSPGRCRAHPAGDRPRVRLIDAACFDAGDPPELYPPRALGMAEVAAALAENPRLRIGPPRRVA